MNIVEFIFRDFWHFIGTIILLGVIGEVIVDIIRAQRK